MLAVANLPVLTGPPGRPGARRDEDATAGLARGRRGARRRPAGYRVLQLPGAEFGAFRWGYTVDPPLPGLTDRPLVTRDLLPLGSAAAMDLLYALDDRFQAGVDRAGAVAPVARLLGADTIWVTGDAAFDRFRTPRPELVHDLFASGRIAGLGPPEPTAPRRSNVPDVPMVDEQSVSDARVGQPVPPVELVPVDDPVPVVRAKDATVVVAGSGDGVVDAAAAGLIDGTELVRYSGSLCRDELTSGVGPVGRVIVTDSNRTAPTTGAARRTSSASPRTGGRPTAACCASTTATSACRCSDPTAGVQTVAVQEGPVRATASAYGEPFAYRPEDRPVMAIDGDPPRPGWWPTGAGRGRAPPPRGRRADRPRHAAPAGGCGRGPPHRPTSRSRSTDARPVG